MVDIACNTQNNETKHSITCFYVHSVESMATENVTLKPTPETLQYTYYHEPGLPRSWKSHGISGILKFSGISGKVMKFCLKLMKVMEKSWNFEIMAKRHGKVMEFDKRILHIYKSPPLHGNLSVSCSFCNVIMELFQKILI